MKLKKIIASILLASMTLSMVACSSTSSSSDDSSSTGASLELKYDGMYSCSDELITLDTFAIFQETYVINNDMALLDEFASYTNVKLNGVASEYTSSSDEAFNLLMTELELPDMIGGDYLDIAAYGMEGAFIPLNDLIEEYAPNIKAMFEAYPEVEAALTNEDGNIYAIPTIYEDTLAQVWYIRQDWLDTLGLDIPTTVDEFEAVLTAFVNEDPNGNGLKDEIGFFMRQGNYDHNFTPLMSLWGVQDQWYVTDEGTVAIGSYTDQFKVAMEGISDWYAKGLIDPEIFTADNYTRDQMWSNDNGGSTHDWIPSTSGFNDSMTETIEDFFVTAMLPPADVNGDVWEPLSRLRLQGDAWGISCDNEYPEESMKFMDFLFGDMGRTVMVYGIEGETSEWDGGDATFYYDEDGVRTYYDYMLEQDQAVNIILQQMGGHNPRVAYLRDSSYEVFMMSESGIADTELYQEADVVNKVYPLIPPLSFTVAETDIITSTWVSCRSYMCEKIQAWVLDGSLIEKEWDTYMENLQKMGMDDVVQVYNDAYARLMANS